MAQEIYNEGRVVGLSAWELFMREALGEGVSPDQIPGEREWLSSMIGSGASLVLKIPSGTVKGVHDYNLPSASNLSAAGVIVASPFLGECEWDSSNWATKVTSYSSLIQNDSEHSPAADGSTVPYNADYSEAECAAIVSQFMKLTDGVAYIKNATWIPTGSSPKKDIDPNFNNSSAVVRLYINADLSSDVYVMFTGFTNKRILQGISGHAIAGDVSSGGSTDIEHNDWADGGMLGPEIIPWASKIIFTVPSAVYRIANSLIRTIPSDSEYIIPAGGLSIDGITVNENAIGGDIRPNSIIDFNAINLTDYYNEHNKMSSVLAENIIAGSFELNDSVNILAAWYPGMTAAKLAEEAQAAEPSNANFFPPALYAIQATAKGSQYLVPIDNAAPGTVKVFTDSDEALKYRQLLPNNFAFYYNTSENKISFVTNSASSEDWPGMAKITYLQSAPRAQIDAGDTSAQFIALTKSSGEAYDTSGSHSDLVLGPENKVTWDDMLSALKDEKSLDILGPKLRNLGTELKTANTIGITNTVTEAGADKVTITGTNPVSMTATTNLTTNLATLGNGQSVKLGTNFIEFSNGLRLYIEGGQGPGTSNVPTGSIGIGW